jgi:hypothetical protein
MLSASFTSGWISTGTFKRRLGVRRKDLTEVGLNVALMGRESIFC